MKDWTIKTLKAIGLFYTCSSIMDSRLSINVRRKLSRAMGSACNVFVLKESCQR